MKAPATWVQGLLLLSGLGCNLAPDNETAAVDASSSTPECQSSAECFDICDTERGVCVKYFEAVCPSGHDQECAPFDGLPFCFERMCSAIQCHDNTDCADEALATTCRNGRCTNTIWKCLNEPVEEASVSLAPVTYEMTVVHALTRRMPDDLQVKLCGDFASDPDCTRPPVLPANSVEIDHAKALVRIKNLNQGRQLRMQLAATGVFNTDFFSERPLRGSKVTALAPLHLIPELDITVVDSPPPDLAGTTSVLWRFFDCEEQLAAGLTVSFDLHFAAPADNDARVVYLKEGDIADPDATQTNAYGAAWIVGLPANTPTRFSVSLGGREIDSLNLNPKQGWVTMIHFDPRITHD